MTAAPPEAFVDVWRWWEARRLRYNIGLAVAGWLAWGLFALEITLFAPMDGGAPFVITPSLVLGQGLAWLVVMAVANGLYLLGAVSETVLRPADRPAYRRWMFGLGFWGSMAVPFLFPAVVLIGLLDGAGM